MIKSVPPVANAWPGIAASGDPSRYALPSAHDTISRKQWPAVTKEDYYKLACALSTEEYRLPKLLLPEATRKRIVQRLDAEEAKKEQVG